MIPVTDSQIIQQIADAIAAGERFAVATLIDADGSTPRRPGARAIIDPDGAIRGTIGGGLMEAQAQQAGQEALASGEAAVLELEFTSDDPAGRDPICGGFATLLIDPRAGERRAYVAAAESLRRRAWGLLMTSVSRGRPREVVIEWAESGESMPVGSGDVVALLERIDPDPLLVICGGGHVGQALAFQASMVGFQPMVIDDRPEFAVGRLFPPGTIVRCGDIAAELRGMEIDGSTHIAIVTRGHQHDAAALAACIGRPAGYIGMMGSRRKVALIREQFLREGLATEAELSRLHAPIGLDIGSQTPQEIAVSVVAEMIGERRRRMNDE